MALAAASRAADAIAIAPQRVFRGVMSRAIAEAPVNSPASVFDRGDGQ